MVENFGILWDHIISKMVPAFFYFMYDLMKCCQNVQLKKNNNEGGGPRKYNCDFKKALAPVCSSFSVWSDCAASCS